MIIYNVLIKDRHCDIEVHSFLLKQVAIDFARQNARTFCTFPGEYVETEYNPIKDNGWILLIETSCEGDYVRVSEGKLK